jgi:hypothetical protein
VQLEQALLMLGMQPGVCGLLWWQNDVTFLSKTENFAAARRIADALKEAAEHLQPTLRS